MNRLPLVRRRGERPPDRPGPRRQHRQQVTSTDAALQAREAA